MFAAKNRVRRSGRGDDDVGAVARVVEVVELDGFAVESVRQANGAVVSTIGDENRGTAMRHQVARRQFAHLARAHNENGLAVQRPENLFGQLDCHRCNGDRGRSHGSLRAHALGHGEGARK